LIDYINCFAVTYERRVVRLHELFVFVGIGAHGLIGWKQMPDWT